VTVFTIRQERIPEQVIPGMRLGRHIWHDDRSRGYAVPELPFGALASVTHERHIPILDQGNVGSCTGNAMDGALGTSPLFEPLPAGQDLSETEALRIYSAAEVIDGNGTYPPVDDGSYGLSVAKAAKNAGLISGYTHCFSRAAMLAALQSGPVIVGMNWYEGFDSPGPGGVVAISGSVRGGHEVVSRGVDMAAGLIEFDNSWGDTWGDLGSFRMPFAVLDRLLSVGGDVTVPLPLSVPAPVPVPVDWTHPDVQFGHDARVIAWAAGTGTGSDEEYAAQQYQAWRHARGYA
jgi:hypothetical protein